MEKLPGTGSTDELSLRVSVATLARVVFQHPASGDQMLALERKATLRENKLEVISQPFGGAIRILDLDAIHSLTGDFNFDSQVSSLEQDFRLFIRPSSWPALRQFCIERLSREHDPLLETGPGRELAEEFADVLKISLQPGQYTSRALATVVEDKASPGEKKASPGGNIHASRSPTVRVYRIYEVSISSSPLAQAMLDSSAGLSDERLCELAREDARSGGKGRANAVLALPLKAITEACLAIAPEARNAPFLIGGHRIEETVAAVLDGVPVGKYQRL